MDADRQKLLRARQTAIFSGGLACVTADVGSVKVGGINQSHNKLRNSRDYTFYSSSLRKDTCSDDIVPAELQKERVAYTVVKDGLKVQGKILLPFTAISASTDGDVKDYKGLLKRKGLGYVDFANLHEDSIHPYQFSVPMQSPFTQDHVGGFSARHNRIGSGKSLQSMIAALDKAVAVDAFNLTGYTAGADPSTRATITVPVSAGGSGTTITIKLDTTAMGGSGNKATCVDAVDMGGYQGTADPSTRFSITIPTAAGGSNTTITIKFDISSTGSPSSFGSNAITIATGGSDDNANAALVVKAINGTTDSRITYGNGSGS